MNDPPWTRTMPAPFGSGGRYRSALRNRSPPRPTSIVSTETRPFSTTLTPREPSRVRGHSSCPMSDLPSSRRLFGDEPAQTSWLPGEVRRVCPLPERIEHSGGELVEVEPEDIAKRRR